ncbi:MAG: glycosyltransferase [Bacteroidia bacterium]|nr:glycosyltransferase [Bacteroidia bacterium]
MRILQVSNRIPYPLNEGGTIGIYNYVKGFAEHGIDVTFASLNAIKHNINLADAKKELEKYCKLYIVNIDTGIKVHKAFFNLFTNNSYNVERFYNNEFNNLLKELLSKNEFDIIQIEGIYASMYIDAIRKFSKAPVVLRQHNVEFQIWERMAANENNIIKKWYLKLLTQRLKKFEIEQLNKFDAVIPVTNDDAEIFIASGCKKQIFISPAGIEVGNFSISDYENVNPFHIYHLGSLEWLPNREAVIWFIENIWVKISKIDKRFKLFVAGKNTPHFFKKYECENIEICGEIKDPSEFLRDKAITVVPLLSGSGIRLKILEAMAVGKLVISTTIGAQGIKYINKKNILIADDTEGFYRIFNNISQNPNYYNEIIQNAKTLIEQEYSNKTVVGKLLNFYRVTYNIN